MHELNFDLKVDQIVARDLRYRRDAYSFVREALDFTQKLISRENQQKVRHVTGQELLDGIRQFALKEFGPMATTVFEEWGITGCPDFGEIVFNMVDVGLLANTEQDRREDFQNGYDFKTAFRKPFLPTAGQGGEKTEVAERN
ncbi:MAG TPA: Minf_1886 family protein [Verrucomicrobiae bacterium]|jgi:uncharacterized repeat protein (TIGR04138 family)|nr:Minf_1886 family protein [Verrucomicrobiae bacterium]